MRRVLLVLLVALVGLAGCGDDTSPAGGDEAVAAAVDAAGVRVVSVDEAATLLAAEPSPTVLDVRTPGEYAEGHLADAVLVDYQAPDFDEQVAELDPDGSYVIYCRSGNRSAGARAVMTELGFTDVADIEGGIQAWLAADQPVVQG